MEETYSSPAASTDGLLFEAVLRPQRSLSAGALAGVAAVLAVFFLYLAVLMLSLGAWPVIACIGLDCALTGLMFWLNHRAGRAREIIQLGENSLRVIRISPAGRTTQTDLPPAWATARLEERPGSVPRLLLGTRDDRLEVARELGEAPKRDLAAALNAALARRASPVFR